jgi:hypothetical protein
MMSVGFWPAPCEGPMGGAIRRSAVTNNAIDSFLIMDRLREVDLTSPTVATRICLKCVEGGRRRTTNFKSCFFRRSANSLVNQDRADKGSTKIWVPGRGYWTKKGFDKPVEQPFDAW